MASNKLPTNKPDLPRRKSGRAVIEDGRSIWEWQTATGVFERDVSSDQLRKLEDANLSIVEDEPTVPSGSYYIYESRPTPPTRAVAQPKATAPTQTPSVFARLFKRTLRRD